MKEKAIVVPRTASVVVAGMVAAVRVFLAQAGCCKDYKILVLKATMVFWRETLLALRGNGWEMGG
jgi:hypothetical protein